MTNWYGIDGIEFHFRGTNRDPEITFKGATDNSCVVVEDSMWEQYRADEATIDFVWYMQDHADYVKELIQIARGTLPPQVTPDGVFDWHLPVQGVM